MTIALRGLMAVFLLLVTAATAATAQSAWVQVEARPSEGEALLRAEDYAGRLPDVQGWSLASGWHAIALGPYSEDEARLRLGQLRAAGAIPRDSFLSDVRNFRDQFFGGAPAPAQATTPAEPLPPIEPGEETVAEARAGERLLDREDRAEIQRALRFEGVYTSAIDADFGPGTRRAIAAWQEAARYEPTGVLTTLQRRELLEGYAQAQTSLGLAAYSDAAAGIEIVLPLGLVRFDRYEPPFAHFVPTGEDGVRVILISQTGDRDTLQALYDVMQTLEIVPLNGSRAIRRDDFTLTGENADISTHVRASLRGDQIKGFALIWPQGDDKRRRLAVAAMDDTFTAIEGALPDSVGASEQDIDLMAGLEIRRPERARSGFWVDAGGSVLTTADAARQCARITLGDDVEADLAASDEGLGLALLRPRVPQAPLAVAKLASEEPRLTSEIAVAGYSFGGILSAPSVTFGTFADVKGLDGDMRVARLDLTAEDGDAGGPVYDGQGRVAGMLLARADDARSLPSNVAFAADAAVLAEFLTANGLSVVSGGDGDEMAPEDLTVLAADMTVLVNCWN
jgi:hypothetical protein